MPTDALTPQPHYRRDIDGLRALAILPVVFYHFRVPGFSGGFVGVDIFFVISGYLITGLLTSAERPLGLVAFYVRRIRRLLPALAAMVAASTVAALILLPPNPLIAYGKSLVSLGVAGSNLFFWRALASYFAASGENHPLLHTWSLSVEEQFYLAFPLFLLVLRRFGRRAQAIGVMAACAVSFVAAAWLAPRAPSSSFYLAPTRAWELLAGGSLMFVRWESPRQLSALLGAVGVALIAFAVATFDAGSQVPGLAAAIPCLGALLLIQVGRIHPGNLVSRLLSAPPLVGIGLISYALYLWHWPINVYLRRYWLTEPPGPLLIAGAITAAFALATLSWFLIERPLRKGALLATPRRAFIFAAVFSALLIGVGVWLAKSEGLPGRLPGLAAVAMQPGEKPNRFNVVEIGRPRFDDNSQWLVQKPGSSRRVMIWGDSYARHLVPGFAALKDELPFSVYEHVGHACPPILGFDPASLPGCRQRNDDALKVIAEQHIDTVILGGRWENYAKTGKIKLESVARTVRQLQAMGLTVIVVGQPPNYEFDFPDEYHYRQVRAGAPSDVGWAANTIDPAFNGKLATALGPVVFDPMPLFCQGQRCLYREHCLYLVRDNGHLTTYASTKLARALLTLPALSVPK